MQYAKGSIGRVFLIKFEHGEDLLKEIEKLADKEGISSATVAIIGALAKADIVTGPKKAELPVTPNFTSFEDGREILGFGTITRKSDGLSLHIHGSYGRDRDTLTGCLRKNSEVFITIEAVITELKDIKATKKKDDRTGLELLAFD
ncbi:MAG: PPC domain-containing DNA-binding protein [Candidatus Omnitrophota bacterium]